MKRKDEEISQRNLLPNGTRRNRHHVSWESFLLCHVDDSEALDLSCQGRITLVEAKNQFRGGIIAMKTFISLSRQRRLIAEL